MGLFSGRIATFSAPAKPEPKTEGQRIVRPSVDSAPFMEACGEAALQAFNACGQLVATGKGVRVNVVWPAEVLAARPQLATKRADNDLLRAIALDLVTAIQDEESYIAGSVDLIFDNGAAADQMLYAQPRRGAMDSGPVILSRGTVSLITKTAERVGMSASRGIVRSVEKTIERLLTEYDLTEKAEAEAPAQANDDAQASVDADGADME